MTDYPRVSDELLQAFVDDQISADDKAELYQLIGHDPQINRQVCELRKLRDLVRLGYRDTPQPPSARREKDSRVGSWLRLGVAASVLLTLGVVLGLQFRLNPPPAVVVATTAPLNTAQPAPDAAQKVAKGQASRKALLAVDRPQSRVLIHVTENDAARLGQALEEIDELMRHYQRENEIARVEVVANGRGLDLLRSDTSGFAERIAALQREHGNLVFAACQNTMDRLKREQGVVVRLLPGVIVIDSGMAELMRRQHQGWTYLQV